MAWAFVRLLAAPYFKLGVSLVAGFVAASGIWRGVPFLLRLLAYCAVTFVTWLWTVLAHCVTAVAKWLSALVARNKERAKTVLSWVGYVGLAAFLASAMVLPYLEGRPDLVDQAMQWTGAGSKRALLTTAAVWSTASTYIDTLYATVRHVREGCGKRVAD
jgi:hypothetical protein